MWNAWQLVGSLALLCSLLLLYLLFALSSSSQTIIKKVSFNLYFKVVDCWEGEMVVQQSSPFFPGFKRFESEFPVGVSGPDKYCTCPTS